MIIRITGSLIMMAVLFVFSSCTKTNEEKLADKQADNQTPELESSAVEDKDFTESDEDLRTVDYKEFYEQLSPHGEWVQVKPEEIGLKTKTASIESPSKNRALTASYKKDDKKGMVYVWKPGPGFGLTGAAGSPTVYKPYSSGQWVNTESGWYFKAPTPQEETTSHYGRWVNSPTAGWLWVPGRVWAPAWVDWKQNDEYVSWAPLPPSVYLANNTVSVPAIDENSYVVVEKKYFLEPDLYKYNKVYYDDGTRIGVNDFNRTDGIMLINNAIVNRGPDVNIFQALLGRTIDVVKLQPVTKYNEIRYTTGEYYIYKPGFKRYKNKNNGWFTVNEPRTYKNYGDWRSETNEYKKEAKENEKELKKEEKEYKKENKGNNGNGKNGNENNGNENNGKGNKDEGGKKKNDNGNKDNGNGKKEHDNGGKNKGNDNKHNGDDNKKGKK